MNQVISSALKEWAVVVEAILEGRHTLLLRKGSVRDVHPVASHRNVPGTVVLQLL